MLVIKYMCLKSNALFIEQNSVSLANSKKKMELKIMLWHIFVLGLTLLNIIIIA